MVHKVIILLSVVAAAYATGEFSILSSPDSLEFKGNENLDTNLLSDVVLSSLGFSIENQENWNGLYIRNPFKLPTSAVLFVVEGVDSLKSDDLKAHTFPLSGQAYDLKSLATRVSDSVLIDLENNKEAVTQISELFGEIKPVAKKVSSALKPGSNVEDKDFLNKIAIVDSLTEKLVTSKNTPSVIVVRLSLESFRQSHSESPMATVDALNILTGTLAELKQALEANSENVLVAAIATTENSFRSKRQAPTPALHPRQAQLLALNAALEYSATYPVIFNIMLWFGVAFFFSLLAIAYAIAYMDPGRDSIIYRMTSTRMKKEN